MTQFDTQEVFSKYVLLACGKDREICPKFQRKQATEAVFELAFTQESCVPFTVTELLCSGPPL